MSASSAASATAASPSSSAAALDPTRPIPTGDDEVAYARWPSDPEAARARRREVEGWDEEIATISAHVTAATYRLLVRLRQFDHWQGWHLQGFKSCASWLAWRTGVTAGTARERVRVARALEHLPRLSEAMERGTLSYSCLRALTRVATPENEERLLEVARVTPAAQLERLVRRWKACERTDAELRANEAERHERRELWLSPAADGSWRIHGRLDPEAGAVLRAALEAAEERLYRPASGQQDSSCDGGGDGEPGEVEPGQGEPAPRREPPRRARWADALGLVAEAALGEGLGGEEAAAPVGRAERFQVVVGVSEETLRGEPLSVGDEPPEVEGGPHLTPDTARRLACDCSTVAITQDGDGTALDVGRKRRRVPPAMRRALDHRDRTCRFPGCGCRYCDAHHIVHWARGGPTRLENLALLCRRHHRLLHEDGWRMTRDDGGALRVYRPDGRELPVVPRRPAAPAEPLRVLERAHRGLGIGPDSPTPDWDGVPIDLDFALEALWWGPEAARRRTKAAGPGAADPPPPSQQPAAKPAAAVDGSAETDPAPPEDGSRQRRDAAGQRRDAAGQRSEGSGERSEGSRARPGDRPAPGGPGRLEGALRGR